jgi:outer membrane protein
MAEAQHRQALAGYWPQVNFKGGYERLDQPLNFIFPSRVFPVPARSISVAGGTAAVTVPANAFGPGFPPAAIQIPVSVPGQTIQTPAQSLTVPEQNVKVLDRDLVTG